MFPSPDDRRIHRQHAIEIENNYHVLVRSIHDPETLGAATLKLVRDEYRKGRKRLGFELRVPVTHFTEWAKLRGMTSASITPADSPIFGTVIRRETLEYIKEHTAKEVFPTANDMEVTRGTYIFKGRIMVPG